MKVPMSALRLSGCLFKGYIDDFLTKGKTFEHCRNNVLKTVKLFDKIGFVVHPEKSQFTARITYLGFIIYINKWKFLLHHGFEKKRKIDNK